MGFQIDHGNVLEWPGSTEGPAEVGGQKLTRDQIALLCVFLQPCSNTLVQVPSGQRAGLKQGSFQVSRLEGEMKAASLCKALNITIEIKRMKTVKGLKEWCQMDQLVG